jgi:hypothetical protein
VATPKIAPSFCGHLDQVRHRAEVVEYRIEAFEDKLKSRLAALRGVV